MKHSPRLIVAEIVAFVLATAAGWSAGCSGGTSNVVGGDGGGAGSDGSSPLNAQDGTSPRSSCNVCLSGSDCGGEVCAQFQGDTFCAPTCGAGEGLGVCASGTTCSLESAFNGEQVSVCVPDNQACGGTVGSSGSGSGEAGDSGSTSPPPVCVSSPSACDGYAAPGVSSTCNSCGSHTSSCQANGCYGGWYCNAATSTCHAPPAGCAAAGEGGTCPADSGTKGSGSGAGADSGSATLLPVTGTVGATGGSVSALYFAVAGDTRPANEDDTAGYPTAIIEEIFSDITALVPQPSFVVSTGDYQFASTTGTESAPQINLYLQARAKFPGVQFPAMGNHECNGYTASNCGSGNAAGVTPNYTNFLNLMLAPVQQSLPYYVIKVNAADGSWTSKFVFIAANAWDAAQASWLKSTLAVATTFTFVIRHEANEANTAPGTTPSEAIVTEYPITLEICGHTHTYSHAGNRVVLGNGGAPLTGSGDYGYGTFRQRSDNAIVVDEIDYKTGLPDASFHFVVTSTGAITH